MGKLEGFDTHEQGQALTDALRAMIARGPVTPAEAKAVISAHLALANEVQP